MKDRSLTLSIAVLLALPAGLHSQQNEEAAAPKAKRVVQLVRPGGTYADLAESGFDMTSLLLGGSPSQTKPFYDMVDQLEALAAVEDSPLVLFDLSLPLGLNLAQMAEMERCLAKLRGAGKRCVAYVESPTGSQYALASQCDEILMADMGTIDLGSLALGTTYMKDAFDMLGIQMDVIRCGDFKGAAEPYMRSRMSDHLRDHYRDMLTRMNDDVVRRIAAGRGLRAEVVRDLQGQRLFSAKQAMAAGLVDRLVPWEGAQRALSAQLGDDDIQLKNALKRRKKKRSMNFMSLMSSLLKPKEEEEVEDETLVVLHLSGPIVDGSKSMPGSIVSGPTVASIRALAKNDQVRGVVVRINSPGGSATASEAIVLALKELSERKPVVCSMGRVAASGGYYVTCFGRPILAEHGTITGSIGVLGVKPNIGPLMRRIGIHTEMVALDESASLDQMDRPWSDADRERMQEMINDIYDRFLNHVAASRQLSREQVEAIAGGRVWSGGQAVEIKLVDRIGGLEDALAMVAKEAGVKPGYEVLHRPRPKSFMDLFAEELMSVRALLAQKLAVAVLPESADLRVPLAMLWDALHHRGPARVWAVMPAELRIR